MLLRSRLYGHTNLYNRSLVKPHKPYKPPKFPVRSMSHKNAFSTMQWNFRDPLLLESRLSTEEQMIKSSVEKYCQEKLFPRIQNAHRHETFDPTIMREMGSMGMLGSTISGYGCPGMN